MSGTILAANRSNLITIVWQRVEGPIDVHPLTMYKVVRHANPGTTELLVQRKVMRATRNNALRRHRNLRILHHEKRDGLRLTTIRDTNNIANLEGSIPLLISRLRNGCNITIRRRPIVINMAAGHEKDHTLHRLGTTRNVLGRCVIVHTLITCLRNGLAREKIRHRRIATIHWRHANSVRLTSTYLTVAGRLINHAKRVRAMKANSGRNRVTMNLDLLDHVRLVTGVTANVNFVNRIEGLTRTVHIRHVPLTANNVRRTFVHRRINMTIEHVVLRAAWVMTDTLAAKSNGLIGNNRTTRMVNRRTPEHVMMGPLPHAIQHRPLRQQYLALERHAANVKVTINRVSRQLQVPGQRSINGDANITNANHAINVNSDNLIIGTTDVRLGTFNERPTHRRITQRAVRARLECARHAMHASNRLRTRVTANNQLNGLRRRNRLTNQRILVHRLAIKLIVRNNNVITRVRLRVRSITIIADRAVMNRKNEVHMETNGCRLIRNKAPNRLRNRHHRASNILRHHTINNNRHTNEAKRVGLINILKISATGRTIVRVIGQQSAQLTSNQHRRIAKEGSQNNIVHHGRHDTCQEPMRARLARANQIMDTDNRLRTRVATPLISNRRLDRLQINRIIVNRRRVNDLMRHIGVVTSVSFVMTRVPVVCLVHSGVNFIANKTNRRRVESRAKLLRVRKRATSTDNFIRHRTIINLNLNFRIIGTGARELINVTISTMGRTIERFFGKLETANRPTILRKDDNRRIINEGNTNVINHSLNRARHFTMRARLHRAGRIVNTNNRLGTRVLTFCKLLRLIGLNRAKIGKVITRGSAINAHGRLIMNVTSMGLVMRRVTIIVFLSTMNMVHIIVHQANRRRLLGNGPINRLVNRLNGTNNLDCHLTIKRLGQGVNAILVLNSTGKDRLISVQIGAISGTVAHLLQLLVRLTMLGHTKEGTVSQKSLVNVIHNGLNNAKNVTVRARLNRTDLNVLTTKRTRTRVNTLYQVFRLIRLNSDKRQRIVMVRRTIDNVGRNIVVITSVRLMVTCVTIIVPANTNHVVKETNRRRLNGNNLLQRLRKCHYRAHHRQNNRTVKNDNQMVRVEKGTCFLHPHNIRNKSRTITRVKGVANTNRRDTKLFHNDSRVITNEGVNRVVHDGLNRVNESTVRARLTRATGAMNTNHRLGTSMKTYANLFRLVRLHWTKDQRIVMMRRAINLIVRVHLIVTRVGLMMARVAIIMLVTRINIVIRQANRRRPIGNGKLNRLRNRHKRTKGLQRHLTNSDNRLSLKNGGTSGLLNVHIGVRIGAEGLTIVRVNRQTAIVINVPHFFNENDRRIINKGLTNIKNNRLNNICRLLTMGTRLKRHTTLDLDVGMSACMATNGTLIRNRWTSHKHINTRHAGLHNIHIITSDTNNTITCVHCARHARRIIRQITCVRTSPTSTTVLAKTIRVLNLRHVHQIGTYAKGITRATVNTRRRLIRALCTTRIGRRVFHVITNNMTAPCFKHIYLRRSFEPIIFMFLGVNVLAIYRHVKGNRIDRAHYVNVQETNRVNSLIRRSLAITGR